MEAVLGQRRTELAARKGGVARRREICSAALGVVRTGLELIVAGAGSGSAQVGGRIKTGVAACSAVQAPAYYVDCWRPREAGVIVEDAADRPATRDLLENVIAVE